MKIPPLLSVGSLLVTQMHAAVLVDFTNQGALYDNQSSVTVPLMDASTGVDFQMEVMSVGGNLNSNVGDFGVGDDVIDFGETIQLSFNVDIWIHSIDFGGVTASTSTDIDRGSVTLGSDTEFFYTARSDFNGTSDVWTPTSAYRLDAGSTLTFSPDQAGANFDLEGMTITAIPEPSVIFLLGMSGLSFFFKRRRSVSV